MEEEPCVPAPTPAGQLVAQDLAMDDDQDEDIDAMIEEEEAMMADEAGPEDGPPPPEEQVAACLTKTQFAACAKQWTRPELLPMNPATDEVTFQQSEVRCHCCYPHHTHHHQPPPSSSALAPSSIATASSTIGTAFRLHRWTSQSIAWYLR